MTVRIRQVLLAILLMGSYAYVLPRWSDWSQNSRLDLVHALVDDGTVVIDRYVANTGDYALYKGHTYSDKAPGPVFLALPVYMVMSRILEFAPVQSFMVRLSQRPAFESTLHNQAAGPNTSSVRFALVQYVLTLLIVALPSALFGLVIFDAFRRLGVSDPTAIICVLGYGLGSTAAPYASNFYSHQLVALLAFGAFWLAWLQPAARPAPRALLCGLLLGWAVISEYPAALLALIIAVYALYRHGKSWAIGLMFGGALPGSLLIVYDLVAFGTIMPIGYAYSALWQDQHHTGFMSLTYPHGEALWGLLFGSFRGLFVRAPWLLLALPGYVYWWRSGKRRAEWLVVALAPLCGYLFYASSGMWWGGFAAGPRYLVFVLPFLALPAAYMAAICWQRLAGRVAVIALIAVSVAIVWIEAVAGALFPTDGIRATWTGYVFPSWAQGNIARNVGMALGLTGTPSLVPLILVAATLVTLLFVPLKARPTRHIKPGTSQAAREHYA